MTHQVIRIESPITASIRFCNTKALNVILVCFLPGPWQLSPPFRESVAQRPFATGSRSTTHTFGGVSPFPQVTGFHGTLS